MEIIQKENEYPLWRIALSNILDAFDSSGYGIEFKHEQIRDWMGIRKPETIKEFKKHELDYMQGMDKLKSELLDESNLYLHSIPGFGYKLLHPSEQISKGADHYLQRSQRNLAKTAHILANVDRNELSIEDKALQISKINRLAFLKAAFRKIKLPENDNKLIE